MTIPILGRLESVELSSVWRNEASFTPWLGANLDLLSEALGLPPLECHKLEHAVGRYYADIVCRIGETGEYLLVENQLEVSDHRHLGQILTYLSGLRNDGLDVRFVVWLARDFRDEHRVAIDCLNKHFAGQVAFFAARIEALRIGTSDTAPRLQVLAQPASIPSRLARNSPPLAQESTDADRVAYWSAFSDELRRRNWPLDIREEAPRTGVYSFTLDSRRGVYLYAYREVAHRRIGCYLSLSLAGNIPKIIFDRWSQEKEVIDREFERPLRWWCKNENTNYRAQIDLENADPEDEDDWERQHRWIADQLVTFYRVFKPRLESLPSVEALRAEAPPDKDGNTDDE